MPKTSKKTKKAPAKRVPKPKPFKISDDISREELLAQYELLEQQKKEVLTVIENVKDQDPFWYFEPTTGIISPEMNEILQKYIKPDDIPQKVDSQLDVLLSKATYKFISGGNRAGKSAVDCIDGIIKTTGELPQSMEIYRDHFKDAIERAKSTFIRGRVVGVDDGQLNRVVIPTWKRWVPRTYLKNGSWADSFSVQYDTLTLYRNKRPCGQVQFMKNSMDVESFQGDDLHWCKHDEEPKSTIWNENEKRFMTTGKIDMSIAWTPTKGLSWATDLASNNDGHISGLFKLCTMSNPKADLETVEQVAKRAESYDEIKMRLLGEFISLSGLIYGNLFHRSLHVVEPFTLNEKEYIVFRGIDPHTAKPTTCVELAVDRMGQRYVVGCYMEAKDTSEIKADLSKRAKERKYRLGWARCDKSANSTNKALSDRNIFLELARGENAIPALDTSEKFTGSIAAGVDAIKQDLKINPITKKPFLLIVDIPENQLLIKAFQTMERETYANEDVKGQKDRIAEGRHDTHAALRYIYQRRITWIPVSEFKVEPLREEVYI